MLRQLCELFFSKIEFMNKLPMNNTAKTSVNGKLPTEPE